MADIAHVAGLVAAGLHPSPVPHCEFVTTTTHKTLRGPRGGMILCKEAWAKDLDKALFPGVQGGPLMHVVAAKAVALLLAATEDFRRDQQRTIENAQALTATLREAGARLVSGGTDNHLALVDVTPLGVTGRDAETLLDDVGITVNKNAIPFDQQPPNIASGIRIGTPATTTRGMGTAEMRVIGNLIVDALRAPDDAAVHDRIRNDVRELVGRFPVPGLPRDRD
jgi:glycine hydroxymethyltransferase